MADSGTLYIVGTPIGNLEDITLRALRVLREVDLIAAEDTRVTAKLLSHFQISTPLTSYHQHSGGRKAEHLLSLLLQGKTIALVSDAGMPGISDPGQELIRGVLDNGVHIEPIPGPTAVITALVVSGLPTNRFCFEGFPPRSHGERVVFFQSLRNDPRTLLFYESPYRLMATLKAMQEVLGDRNIAIGRELTKLHEEVVRGRISDAIHRFSEVKPRGEVVIVLEGVGADEVLVSPAECDELSVEDHLRQLIAGGLSEKDAIRRVVMLRNLPKRQVYAIALGIKESSQ